MEQLNTNIEGNSLQDVWKQYVNCVYHGSQGQDGAEAIREKFLVNVCFSPNADFARLDPAMDIKQQRQYVKKLLTTELDPVLGGSYGYRIKKSYGVDQMEALLKKLLEKPESKAACVNLLHPVDAAIERDAGMQRMACMVNFQVLMRDEMLHLIANFRSQNAWNSHGNFVGLHELHQQIVQKLSEQGVGVGPGSLIIHVVAAHLYERDFAKAAALA